jgi:hypothetical protein
MIFLILVAPKAGTKFEADKLILKCCKYDRTSCLERVKFITEDYFSKRAQTLQLFTKIIKTDIMYKSNYNAKLEGLD